MGTRWGPDGDWSEEVKVLLEQAFESRVPAEDFIHRRLLGDYEGW